MLCCFVFFMSLLHCNFFVWGGGSTSRRCVRSRMTRVPFSAEWYHCTFLGCGFVVKSWRRGLEGVLLVTSNKRTNEIEDGGELSIF